MVRILYNSKFTSTSKIAQGTNSVVIKRVDCISQETLYNSLDCELNRVVEFNPVHDKQQNDVLTAKTMIRMGSLIRFFAVSLRKP